MLASNRRIYRIVLMMAGILNATLSNRTQTELMGMLCNDQSVNSPTIPTTRSLPMNNKNVVTLLTATTLLTEQSYYKVNFFTTNQVQKQTWHLRAFCHIWSRLHFFLHTAPVALFSRAWYKLHVCPHLKPVARFLALGTGRIFFYLKS